MNFTDKWLKASKPPTGEGWELIAQGSGNLKGRFAALENHPIYKKIPNFEGRSYLWSDCILSMIKGVRVVDPAYYSWYLKSKHLSDKELNEIFETALGLTWMAIQKETSDAP